MSAVNTWMDTLQSFGSLLVSQCYRETFLANFLRQKFVNGEKGKNLTLGILMEDWHYI